jgi:predicted transcriptional regulator of viral defense system
MQERSEPALEGLSAQQRRILGVFIAKGLPVIRVEDVQSVHATSRKAANVVLSRLHQKGWLRRLERGSYALVPLESATTRPAIEDAWSLAMELFAPCYISGWSAAEHWSLTEQVFQSIAVVTGHPQRSSSRTIAGLRFRVRAIAPARIFGTSSVWVGSNSVAVADPHRLLIDVLDSPELGGGGVHTMEIVDAYWKSSHHDAQKLLKYALRYGRGAVLKRLGFSAERAGVVSGDWLDLVEGRLSQGIIRLDPKSGNLGALSRRWRLRVNIPLQAT